MRIRTVAARDAHLADLANTITKADGLSPLNELGQLALSGERDATCLIPVEDDTPLGFALIDHLEQTVQLAVHPDHRRMGVGTALAKAAASHPAARRWWAFGDFPAAQALAASLHLVRVRQLLQMSRPLDETPATAPPPGFRLSAFSPADAEAIVEVNARAFASHPEQGNLTMADFTALRNQPWFDPAGLIVAKQDGRVAGFHWTKRHSPEIGEVYVLAVDPQAGRRGLGRALLEAGLQYLAAAGATTVMLYVEASAPRTVAMYEAAKFKTVRIDASYTPESDNG